MHDLSLIVMLAGALAVALVMGWLTQRIGLSTLVGYILAGILVGPHTPGFVADAQSARQMAEIGVILLMFGVGMHFHPQELLRVWRIAARVLVLVVTNPTLAEKMRICSAARRLNPRITILATSESEAERAWLQEFGVTVVSDMYDEMSTALARAVRRAL
jgi:hypothetical protein